MFASFFPSPRLFLLTAIAWAAVAIALWYAAGDEIGEVFGFPPADPQAAPIIGVEVFWSPGFLFFYLYYAFFVGAFAAFWMFYYPHPWANWSILGSGLILFVTYFQVQVSVAINAWYGPFYDMIQAALAKTAPVTLNDFFGQLLTFAGIAFVAVAVGVMTRFFVSHYVFRWRTAMNDYYLANWARLRTIEGASQRVQEDTMRFAATMEGLGVSLIDSIMTLVAFLPVLVTLSANVTELPFIGEVPYALVIVAIVWSVFGTGFLALVGIRLPGLEFRNQRVEAAFRKELVFGEDNPGRAQPQTMRELFANVRRNYFRLYLNYMYFNVGRIVYLQTDIIFPYIILAPTIVAGKITLGAMNQILLVVPISGELLVDDRGADLDLQAPAGLRIGDSWRGDAVDRTDGRPAAARAGAFGGRVRKARLARPPLTPGPQGDMILPAATGHLTRYSSGGKA